MLLRKIIIILSLLVLVFWSFHTNNKSDIRRANVSLLGKNFSVEIADNDARRTKGLSGRESLRDDEGMLFVFNTPGHYGFWMKEMNFPIDMVWIDENMTVVHIKNSAEPSSYPEVFIPEREAKYVLEIPAGESERLNLKIGTKVKIDKI